MGISHSMFRQQSLDEWEHFPRKNRWKRHLIAWNIPTQAFNLQASARLSSWGDCPESAPTGQWYLNKPPTREGLPSCKSVISHVHRPSSRKTKLDGWVVACHTTSEAFLSGGFHHIHSLQFEETPVFMLFCKLLTSFLMFWNPTVIHVLAFHIRVK